MRELFSIVAFLGTMDDSVRLFWSNVIESFVYVIFLCLGTSTLIQADSLADFIEQAMNSCRDQNRNTQILM